MGGVKSALAAGTKSGWKVKEEGDKEVEKDEVVVERVVRSARVERREPGGKREINFYLPGTSLGVSGGPKGGRT